ncbi:unnamed protein product [Prorocentrum cordatum]|uniref:RmlD-like substrate binding domain-containing protein n=1 Tax=Prorocentrum cordatum TaxID=2364126 RepID=A0ABN9TIB9_9DINO|nr:unnamed protein product [Polarella glacialis]
MWDFDELDAMETQSQSSASELALRPPPSSLASLGTEAGLREDSDEGPLQSLAATAEDPAAAAVSGAAAPGPAGGEGAAGQSAAAAARGGPRRALVTGASGLLGRQVLLRFERRGWTVRGLAFNRCSGGLVRCNILERGELEAQFRDFGPSVVIHCAAERRPGSLETDPEYAARINAEATRCIGELCSEHDAWLVFLSTNYVFDGRGAPYAEDAVPNPLSVYGKTEACPGAAVVRVPLLYGPLESPEETSVSALLGPLLELSGAAEPTPKAFDNWQQRYPTSTEDLAAVLESFCDEAAAAGPERHGDFAGIFHWQANEMQTRYTMALAVAEIAGVDQALVAKSDEAPSQLSAPRPQFEEMRCTRLERLIGADREPGMFRSDFRQGLRQHLEPFLPKARVPVAEEVPAAAEAPTAQLAPAASAEADAPATAKAPAAAADAPASVEAPATAEPLAVAEAPAAAEAAASEAMAEASAAVGAPASEVPAAAEGHSAGAAAGMPAAVGASAVVEAPVAVQAPRVAPEAPVAADSSATAEAPAAAEPPAATEAPVAREVVLAVEAQAGVAEAPAARDAVGAALSTAQARAAAEAPAAAAEALAAEAAGEVLEARAQATTAAQATGAAEGPRAGPALLKPEKDGLLEKFSLQIRAERSRVHLKLEAEDFLKGMLGPCDDLEELLESLESLKAPLEAVQAAARGARGGGGGAPAAGAPAAEPQPEAVPQGLRDPPEQSSNPWGDMTEDKAYVDEEDRLLQKVSGGGSQPWAKAAAWDSWQASGSSWWDQGDHGRSGQWQQPASRHAWAASAPPGAGGGGPAPRGGGGGAAAARPAGPGDAGGPWGDMSGEDRGGARRVLGVAWPPIGPKDGPLSVTCVIGSCRGAAGWGGHETMFYMAGGCTNPVVDAEASWGHNLVNVPNNRTGKGGRVIGGTARLKDSEIIDI